MKDLKKVKILRKRRLYQEGEDDEDMEDLDEYEEDTGGR